MKEAFFFWGNDSIRIDNVGGVLMRDIDIRRVLCKQLRATYRDDPGTLIVEELGVRQGAARVDIAVVNGFLQGYEIKSAKDTLDRLPNQSKLYSTVFDNVTLVTSEEHLEPSINTIPEWWGVVLADTDAHGVFLVTVREAATNASVDSFALVQLLWREEALQLLRNKNAATGYLSKPRTTIWQRVCEVYSLDELREAVRSFLKERNTLIKRNLI